MAWKDQKPPSGNGWGGPAKGYIEKPARAYNSMTPTRETIPGGRGDPEKMQVRNSRQEQNAQRAQALKDHLFNLATEAEREETQVRAAEAWLNRHEGMPVSRNLNVNVNEVSGLTDAELDAEIARLAREAGNSGDADVGEASQELSSQPSDVVH